MAAVRVPGVVAAMCVPGVIVVPAVVVAGAAAAVSAVITMISVAVAVALLLMAGLRAAGRRWARRHRVWVETVGLERGVELADDLNLERRVANAHLLRHADCRLQRRGNLVLVGDHQVRRADEILRAHGPDVQVVHGIHTGNRPEALRQPHLVEVLRSLHHQGVDRLLQGRLRCEEDQDSEEHRAHRVRIVPLADAVLRDTKVERLQPDAESSQADAQGLHDVPDHMRDRSLHGQARLALGSFFIVATAVAVPMAAVPAMAVTMAEHLHQDDVDEEAQRADGEHVGRFDLLQVVEALERLHQQPRCQRPDDRHREERT
mmetsp:Transcript_240/g.620  ORF Transcript_240/g.620 Transcript_240/m.620 type:complete len:318 (+) Transcript_240:149-1102(+)